jgi:seryl-tRNA synthetase
MLDIKWIRENPEVFDAGLATRCLPGRANALIELD